MFLRPTRCQKVRKVQICKVFKDRFTNNPAAIILMLDFVLQK